MSSGPGVHRASSGQIPATGDTQRAPVRALTPPRSLLDFQSLMTARIGFARADAQRRLQACFPGTTAHIAERLASQKTLLLLKLESNENISLGEKRRRKCTFIVHSRAIFLTMRWRAKEEENA